MSELQSGEDPEPSQPVPAGTLFVPVRPGSVGPCVRLFRTPLGGRTAVVFTTEQQLTSTLGRAQPWIRLCESAVRALTEPLGVTALTVDPQLAAPAAVPRPAAPAQPVTAPHKVPAQKPAPALHRPPAQDRAAAAPQPPGDTAELTSGRRAPWDPQTVGALRVAGIAAAASCLSLFIG
jgi:hypothetical protein